MIVDCFYNDAAMLVFGRTAISKSATNANGNYV